jgi:hypothetical protein
LPMCATDEGKESNCAENELAFHMNASCALPVKSYGSLMSSLRMA